MIAADTSVLIEFLRGKIALEEIHEHGEIATCYPMDCELYKGTRIARNTEEGEKQVKKLIERTETLQADRESSRKFAELKEKYPEISELDLMIAGICLSHNVKILTRDSDFQKIDELKTEKI